MKLEVGKVYVTKSGKLMGVIAKAEVDPIADGMPIPTQALAPYLVMPISDAMEEYNGRSAFYYLGTQKLPVSALYYTEEGEQYPSTTEATAIEREAKVLRKLGPYLSKENGYSAIITEHFIDADGVIYLIGRLYLNGKFARVASWKNDTGRAHLIGDPDLILED